MSITVSYKDNTIATISEYDGTKTLTTQGAWLEDNITIGDQRPIAYENNVNLYDYDGWLLYSYTKAEFLALTDYPSAPVHQGLVSTGWNWDLADAKTYVTSYGGINIGHTYITDDDTTRLYINIISAENKTVHLRYYQSAANGVEIDWGDGSSKSKDASTGNRTVSHAYSNFGRYKIVITRLTGNYCLGASSGNIYLFNTSNAQQILYKVEIGNTNRTSAPDFAGNYCFRHANNLETITIPNKYKHYMNYIFGNASMLKCVIVPKEVSSITTSYVAQHQYCMNCRIVPSNFSRICNTSSNASASQLYTFYIPSAVTAIASGALYPTTHIEKLVVPSGVTSIGGTSLSIGFLRELWMYPSSPPTLTSTSFNGSVQSDLVIYVPSGSLSAYQSAANWSTYSDHMVEMS